MPKQAILEPSRSFTSGFYWPDASGFVPCLGQNASQYTHEQCAKEIYDTAPFEFEPGRCSAS